MEEFLHNCRKDVTPGRKELTSKDGETVLKTSKGTVIAKEVEYDLGNVTKTRHFVAVFSGSLYDPTGGYSNRETRIDIELKPTNKETFTHYTKYVQTNNRLSFIAAERSFLNGN